MFFNLVFITFLLGLCRIVKTDSVSCNFNVDLCEWENEDPDDLQWSTGDSSSLLGIPPTPDGGQFAYLKSTGDEVENGVLLGSSMIVNSSFALIYRVFARKVDTLRFTIMLIRTDNSGSDVELIAEIDSSTSNWENRSIDIIITESTTISFEISGTMRTEDEIIAFDNIRLVALLGSESTTSSPPTDTTLSPTEIDSTVSATQTDMAVPSTETDTTGPSTETPHSTVSSTETDTTIPSTEIDTTVLSTETDTVVSSTETDTVVSSTETDIIGSSTETLSTVSSTETLTVSSTETDTVVPSTETDTVVSSTETDIIGSSTETLSTVSSTETLTVSSTETDTIVSSTETDTIVSSTETDIIVPSTETDKTVSSTEADTTVSSTETETTVSPTETETTVSPAETPTETVSPTETETTVSPTETATTITQFPTDTTTSSSSHTANQPTTSSFDSSADPKVTPSSGDHTTLNVNGQSTNTSQQTKPNPVNTNNSNKPTTTSDSLQPIGSTPTSDAVLGSQLSPIPTKATNNPVTEILDSSVISTSSSTQPPPPTINEPKDITTTNTPSVIPTKSHQINNEMKLNGDPEAVRTIVGGIAATVSVITVSLGVLLVIKYKSSQLALAQNMSSA